MLRLPGGEAGSAGLEYTLFLALILAFAAVAVIAARNANLGDSVSPLSASLSANEEGRAVLSGPAGRRPSSVVENQDGQDASQTMAARRSGMHRFLAAATVLGLIGVWAGWKTVRRRGRKDKRSSKDLPAAESAIPENPAFSKRQELLQSLLNDRKILWENRLEVRHLMTGDPMRISPKTSFKEMSALMKDRRVRHLLVCGKDNRLLGVVSDRDLRNRAIGTAEELMSSPVLTVPPETSLGPAITFLISQGISCLPVVDQGRVCGVITTTDLMMTLQCALRLCMHAAQVAEKQQESSNHLGPLMQQLADGAAKQRELVADLVGRCQETSGGEGGQSRPLPAAEIERLSEETNRLVGQIAEVQHCLGDQTRRLSDVLDWQADALTGLSNRRGLQQLLEMLLAAHKRYRQVFSVVIVAIDDFSQIAEAHGDHAAMNGLRAVASLINGSMRASDFVGRYEHDSLGVILFHTGLDGTALFAERLRKAVEEDSASETPLTVTAAVVSPQEDEPLACLLARAEMALAAAQSDGGNRVCGQDGAAVAYHGCPGESHVPNELPDQGLVTVP